MKDKGPGSLRNFEEILEYMPILCDNYKEHPIMKMLNEGKTHYGPINIDIDVCDKDQKFYNDECLEFAEKKFYEIINEIFNSGFLLSFLIFCS